MQGDVVSVELPPIISDSTSKVGSERHVLSC